MGIRFSYRQKDCAVCVGWDGVGKVSVDKAWADVASSAQIGICKNPKAMLATKGEPIRANYSSCPCFEKWPALK